MPAYDNIDALIGPPMHAVANAIRGMICAPKGRKLIAADFSQINALDPNTLGGLRRLHAQGRGRRHRRQRLQPHPGTLGHQFVAGAAGHQHQARHSQTVLPGQHTDQLVQRVVPAHVLAGPTQPAIKFGPGRHMDGSSLCVERLEVLKLRHHPGQQCGIHALQPIGGRQGRRQQFQGLQALDAANPATGAPGQRTAALLEPVQPARREFDVHLPGRWAARRLAGRRTDLEIPQLVG